MKLPLYRDILISNLLLGDMNVFDYFFRDNLRDVLSKILDSIVICYSNLFRNIFNPAFLSVFHFFHLLRYPHHYCLVFILNYLLFEWNIFNPTFTLYNFLPHIHSSPFTLPIHPLLSTHALLSTCSLGAWSRSNSTSSIILGTDIVAFWGGWVCGLIVGCVIATLVAWLCGIAWSLVCSWVRAICIGVIGRDVAGSGCVVVTAWGVIVVDKLSRFVVDDLATWHIQNIFIDNM